MPDNPTLRRLMTIPAVIVLFVILTVGSPVFALATVSIDSVRSISSGRPWIASRGVLFLWVYLLGELWALLALVASAPLPRASRDEITFDLQGVWARWNLKALCRLFSIEVSVEGQDNAKRGPLILLSRHASLVDTLLPANLVANPHRIRLRYVLKRELLFDPALDIAGNRLPNYFVDRSGEQTSNEIAAIGELARHLQPNEGVLIYPEGTRFSEEKRERYVSRLTRHGGALGRLAAGFRTVLPPRAAGTLALLETSDADVVLLAHHGLEGLATVGDIWAGGLVGTTIEVALWRIPRSAIPTERNEQVEWLFEVWRAVDEWVVNRTSPERPQG